MMIFSMLLVELGVGVLMILLALPMILNWVKPNWWYGFRTTKTLSDERIWYAANHYAGKALLLTGVACAALAAALYWLAGQPAYASLLGGPLGAVLVLVLLFVPLAICVAASLAYLRKL